MPFMTHPEHGAINIPDAEVPAHEKLGWKLDTFERYLAEKNKANLPEEAQAKRGRPAKAKE